MKDVTNTTGVTCQISDPSLAAPRNRKIAAIKKLIQYEPLQFLLVVLFNIYTGFQMAWALQCPLTRSISVESYWKKNDIYYSSFSFSFYNSFLRGLQLTLLSVSATSFLPACLPLPPLISWAPHPSGPIEAQPTGVVRPPLWIYTALFLFVSLLDLLFLSPSSFNLTVGIQWHDWQHPRTSVPLPFQALLK